MAEILIRVEHALRSNSHLRGAAGSASPASEWLLAHGKSGADCTPIGQRLLGTCHYSDVELLPQNRSLLDTCLSPRRIGDPCRACAGSSTSALSSWLPSTFRHDFLWSKLCSLRRLWIDSASAGGPAYYARAAASAGRVSLEQASLPYICIALVRIPTLQAGPR